jgi:hypothetical protein
MSLSQILSRLPVRGAVTVTEGPADAQKVVLTDEDGKIDSSLVPAVFINDVFVVADQAERLALAATKGDVAKQTDEGKAYILQQEPASNNTNWIEIGDVAIDISDVNGLQNALDDKVSRNGDVMSGDLDMDSNRIVNLPAPVDPQDAINKEYVDNQKAFIEISGATTLQHGRNYAVDTSGGSFTVTLPGGSIGGKGVVVLLDSTGSWGVNPLTVNRNGNTIDGAAENLTCNIPYKRVELIPLSTNDWRVVFY